jgi:purine-binding chemotaxis protein CheW
MRELNQFVVFCLDAQRYALSLAVVERSVRAVEVTGLPNAPAIVLGVINVEGRVLPVLNLRRRFGLPEREISLSDQFLIARTTRRTVVLVVDETQGVIEYPKDEIIGPAQIVPGLGQIQGAVKLPDGLVLIHDLELFLSLEEVNALDAAMAQEVAHAS